MLLTNFNCLLLQGINHDPECTAGKRPPSGQPCTAKRLFCFGAQRLWQGNPLGPQVVFRFRQCQMMRRLALSTLPFFASSRAQNAGPHFAQSAASLLMPDLVQTAFVITGGHKALTRSARLRRPVPFCQLAHAAILATHLPSVQTGQKGRCHYFKKKDRINSPLQFNPPSLTASSDFPVKRTFQPNETTMIASMN